MPLLSVMILASTTWKFRGEEHCTWFLSIIAQPLQSGCLRGMYMIDSLPLSCFLDCCFGMLISILLCGILTSVSASMRGLFCGLHFFVSVWSLLHRGWPRGYLPSDGAKYSICRYYLSSQLYLKSRLLDYTD